MNLDHVIVGVADLDAATARFETILGLPAAVRSDHPTYGTRNALFLFKHGPYLELLGLRPDAAGGFVTPLRDFLARRGDGLYGIALAPADIDAAVARLRNRGYDVAEARRGTGVDAGGRERAWRNTRLPAEALNNSFSLLIEHEGWDWRTDLRREVSPARAGSAATGIHHVVFDTPDARQNSLEWQRRFGLEPSETIESERMGATVIVHRAGEASIEAASTSRPDGPVAERFARNGEGLSSIAFTVADLPGAVASLRAAGLTVSDPAPGVLPESQVTRIDPASAHGVAAQLIQFAPVPA